LKEILAEPKEASDLDDMTSKLTAPEREGSKLSRELRIMDLDTLRCNQFQEILEPSLASSAKVVRDVGLALAVSNAPAFGPLTRNRSGNGASFFPFIKMAHSSSISSLAAHLAKVAATHISHIPFTSSSIALAYGIPIDVLCLVQQSHCMLTALAGKVLRSRRALGKKLKMVPQEEWSWQLWR